MCFLGTCGCSGGKTLCTNGCIDTRTDEANCGACGNVCNEPRPAFPQDWHAKYGCVDGACYVPICRPGWFDCNGDFLDPGGDGCEINGDEDTANCGGCGLACGVGEVCDYGRCKCACGTGCSFPLEADVDNCGACGFRCPGARSPLPQMSEPFVDISHGGPICDRGLCDYRCSEGWADCDGDIQNGCETRLLDDPRHCGTCGVRCDGVEGQACVEGVCTTKGCTVQ
jgi:hypothetical protein